MKAIDLGLSVKWADCNVGANYPEEKGDYFSFGEIKPKEDYHWDNYFAYADKNFETFQITKENDAASVNCGDSWRMPTKEEIEELITKCTWKPSTLNKVKGFKVIGENNNWIFLPCSYFKGNYFYDNNIHIAFYYSKTIVDGQLVAYSLYFDVDKKQIEIIKDDLYFGETIRPVCE